MLYGRCEERALIAGLLAQARRGHGGVLVVRGEAGIGKHALLQDAAEQATGFQQLRCSGIEAEVELPFAGLQQLPAPKPRRCGGAFGLVDAGTDTNRFLVELGALSLVAVAAAEQPLLCLIGQARWLDPASADALVFVARRLQSERIVVLFAAREGEARQFQAPDLPELRLGGLGPAGAGERLAAQVGPLAPRSATGWSPRPAATRWPLRSYPKP